MLYGIINNNQGFQSLLNFSFFQSAPLVLSHQNQIYIVIFVQMAVLLVTTVPSVRLTPSVARLAGTATLRTSLSVLCVQLGTTALPTSQPTRTHPVHGVRKFNPLKVPTETQNPGRPGKSKWSWNLKE